jgi:FkbM family methyltransferase
MGISQIMGNQNQKILDEIAREYCLAWPNFATSRPFTKLGTTPRNLSRLPLLDGISAILMHKGDIDRINLTLLKDMILRFDVLTDASELVVLVRRSVETGLRKRRYLIAAAREFHVLANERIAREDHGQLRGNQRNDHNLRRVFYVGDNVSLTVTRHGQMLYVDTLDVSLSPHLLVSGDWEPGVTQFFRSRLKPGMRYLEIGANCGWFTIQAAALVGPKGYVVAFEPNSHYAGLIRSSLTVNGLESHCKIVEKAVCDRNEELTFSIFRKFRGNSTLLHAESVAEKYDDTFDVITVHGVTLDAHFPAGETFDFIKIDAESAEIMILNGGTRFFEENRNAELIIEASPYSDAVMTRHVTEALIEMGYTCLRIDAKGHLSADGLTENGIEIFAKWGTSAA